MQGVDLNKPIIFLNASLRFFKENEYHITRHSTCDVLMLVYDGILRFSENGTEHEIHPGQYYILRKGGYHTAQYPSNAPKYFYIHFISDWAEDGVILPMTGTFDYAGFKQIIETLDTLCHNDSPHIEQTAKAYEILSMLYNRQKTQSLANEIADYIEKEYLHDLSLEQIAQQFHFSKNHIINLFKNEYGITPFEHINNLKLKQAERLLEVTSDSAKSIAFSCGFNDYAYFYRQFQRKNALSPAEWRKLRRIGKT